MRFYRTFYASDGQTYKDVADPTRPTPELVVFFTDGVPTYDRLETRSDSNSTTSTGDSRHRSILAQDRRPATAAATAAPSARAGGAGPTTSSTSSARTIPSA